MKKVYLFVLPFLMLHAAFAQNLNDTVYVNGELFLHRDLTAPLQIVHSHIDTAVQPHSHELWAYYLSKPHPAVATVNQYFLDASAEFNVPVDILKTIGQIENNWTQMGPSIDQGWGIMHLVQNDYCNTLNEAATLLQTSEQLLKDDARQNIRGAAALLRTYFNQLTPAADDTKIENWYPAVKKFSGLISGQLQTIQADRYYSVLKDGAHSTTLWNEEITLPRHPELDMAYIAVHFNSGSGGNPAGGSRSSDYAPAVSSLTTCNFTTTRNHSIDTWVNHWIGTGTAAGAVSWFQNCSAQASAHFVTANNGTIYQVVPVANAAWHCGASGYPYNNGRSIGEEHEATNANPGLWNSTAMLQASAQMACYFCSQYGIATNQNHTSPGICGHQNMPGTNTDCPGTIPWTNWFNYFNTGSCNAVAVQPANDYCGNEVALTVYGSSCGGATTGDLNGATQSTAPIACGGYTSTGAKDVWFKFTATATAHDITVVPSGGLDAVVDLRSGCPGTNIDCADAGGGEGATEILHATGLTIGAVYNVRVYDYSGANVAPTTTSFTICVTTPVCTPPVKPLIAGSHSICAGQTTTLSVSNTCNNCTYNWSNGSTGSQIIAGTAGNYVVSAANTCGTSASDAFGFTVTPVVTPSIAISTPATSICAGSNVTFTAIATNGGSTPVYTWKKNGITAGTNSSTYSTSQLADGDIILCNLTSNATCAGTNTAASNSITMTVAPILTPAINITANTGTSICTGQSVIFTASSTNGGTTPVYQWKLNGNNIATGATYTNNAIANGDVITCQLTTSLTTCVSQPTALSNSLSMAVNASVVPAITISTVSDTLCAGQNAVFTATALGGGNSPVYQWIKNTQPVNGANSDTFSTAALITGDSISCLLTSNAGCASTSTANSNSIHITALPVVLPGVTIYAPVTDICAGSGIIVTTSVTNGGTSPTYQWTINGAIVSDSSSPGFVTNNISNGDTLRVIATSNARCAVPVTAISNGVPFTVSPWLTPGVAIMADTAGPLCNGAPVNFTAQAVNGGNPTYSWYKNGLLTGFTGAYYSDSVVNGDAVYCLLQSTVACSTVPSGTPISSDTLTLSTVPPAIPGVTISSNSGQGICAGSSVTFTATPVNGGTNPAYTWQVNGQATATGNPYTTSAVNNGDVVTCNITSNLSCVTNNGMALSNPLQLTVGGNTVPVVQKNGCDLVAGFIANVAYQWYYNAAIIPGANSRFYSATQTGYYNVSVADSFFCTAQSADVFVDYTACTTTGLADLNKAGFSLLQLGASAWQLLLSPENANSKVEVFDALGQLVANPALSGNKSLIDLSAFPSGVYFVHCTGKSNRLLATRILKM